MALLVERPRRRRLPRALAVAAIVVAAAIPGYGRVRAPAPRPAATLNRPFEIRVPAPPGRLADEVAAHVDVVAPSGAAVRLPAFASGAHLAARVRPREAGVHGWRVVEDAAGAPREIASGSFRAGGAGGPSGQVRARGAALATDDGLPFLPLGENRFDAVDPSWSDGLVPDAYVARMAADGMNTIRVLVLTACGREGAAPSPGCLEPSLGRFDPDAAARYDAVFEAAERHGVKVVLSIFAAGFTPGDGWKGWEDNPYAAARGGPARTPADFFTDPAARRAAHRRLRYVLARWSASPALLAVELLDEPERDGAIPEDRWMPWAEEMARTWRAEDPYGHLVTAGPVGLHGNVERDERPWWAAAGSDVVQWHRFGPDVNEVHDLADALVATVRDTARHGKPVLVGGFGWGGEPKPGYDHAHVGIWAATFAGAGVLANTAPPFSIDPGEPKTAERGRHFRSLAAFLARAGREALSPAGDPEVSVPGMRALSLAGKRTVALWLLAPREGYGDPVEGARVVLRRLAPGRWRATWVDDATGEEMGTEEREVTQEEAVLVAPRFVRHVAAVVERVDGLG